MGPPLNNRPIPKKFALIKRDAFRACFRTKWNEHRLLVGKVGPEILIAANDLFTGKNGGNPRW
jgi:hypothetical protein